MNDYFFLLKEIDYGDCFLCVLKNHFFGEITILKIEVIYYVGHNYWPLLQKLFSDRKDAWPFLSK